jgi:hypothetical protein
MTGGGANSMLMATKPTTRTAVTGGGSVNTMLMETKPTTRTAMAGASMNTMLMATKPTTRTAMVTKKGFLVANPVLVRLSKWMVRNTNSQNYKLWKK